jgi:hypothetical protein
MSKLAEEMPELKASLANQRFEDSRADALILINGREISVLGFFSLTSNVIFP